MRLLIQPGSGVQPLLSAIERAKKSIEIVIFRFDEREIERALANAVARGVFVHALIAHTTGTGEEELRKLEMRFLDAGINVVRTSDDLIRYHDKLLIIDEKILFVLSFNFTHAISRSPRDTAKKWLCDPLWYARQTGFRPTCTVPTHFTSFGFTGPVVDNPPSV